MEAGASATAGDCWYSESSNFTLVWIPSIYCNHPVMWFFSPPTPFALVFLCYYHINAYSHIFSNLDSFTNAPSLCSTALIPCCRTWVSSLVTHRCFEAVCLFPNVCSQPSGKGRRLPEVYCIVSRLGCFDLFSKVCKVDWEPSFTSDTYWRDPTDIGQYYSQCPQSPTQPSSPALCMLSWLQCRHMLRAAESFSVMRLSFISMSINKVCVLFDVKLFLLNKYLCETASPS